MTAHPSWQHELVVRVLIPLMGVRRSNSVSQLAKSLETKSAKPELSPSRAVTRNLVVEQSEHHGWVVWIFRPTSRAATGRVLLAIHGGAYVLGIQSAHYKLYAFLAEQAQVTVVVPLYPLAPAVTATEVVPAMADYLTSLIVRFGADRVSVSGDSAGGGLALAAVQECVRRKVATPRSLLLISPWLDVTVPDPRSTTVDDPMLDIDGLRYCGRLWAGGLDPRDPRVSPIYGRMEGLPPMVVYAGTLDVLFPDSTRLAELATAAGVPVTLDLRPGLMHTWPLASILPEARQTLVDLVAHLAVAPDAPLS